MEGAEEPHPSLRREWYRKNRTGQDVFGEFMLAAARNKDAPHLDTLGDPASDVSGLRWELQQQITVKEILNAIESLGIRAKRPSFDSIYGDPPNDKYFLNKGQSERIYRELLDNAEGVLSVATTIGAVDSLKAQYVARVAKFGGELPPWQKTKIGIQGDREWAAENGVGRQEIKTWRDEIGSAKRGAPRKSPEKNKSPGELSK
jgi:hypothetical protein